MYLIFGSLWKLKQGRKGGVTQCDLSLILNRLAEMVDYNVVDFQSIQSNTINSIIITVFTLGFSTEYK